MTIQPFTVDVQDAVLADLRARLAHTRWPETVEGAGWSMGTDIAFLRRLCAHWAQAFDWRAQERAINAFPHFKTEIAGQTLHFVHARAPRGNAIPLLLLNGWPSNFYEMLPMVSRLTQGAPAFDVVIPSLPGYGFSPPAAKLGMHMSAMADLFAALMTRLGYARFIVHGSDVGARVAERLRSAHAERMLGVHFANAHRDYPKPADPTPEESGYLEATRRWWREEGAYFAIQHTKPMTLAFGLSDSPAGLAGWIVEKFRTWSDCGGDIERVYTLDQLCTILTIYWATNTIGSSVRVYHDRDPGMRAPARNAVPVGVAVFPKDILPAPRVWAERWHNLVHWSEMPRGGHFPALETPDLLAEDLRAFAAKLA